jgi:hypothetical protein
MIPRALATALIGAMAGAACLSWAFAWHPDLSLEMDRDLPPRIASGFYPVERNGGLTFAWTSSRAQVTLAGMDRRSPWRCSVRFRGGRSSEIPQPSVSLVVDGVTLVTKVATNDYQDLEVTTPLRADGPGLELAVLSSTTFNPGRSDPRALGVQIDRLSCQPAGSGMTLPPRRAIIDAAFAAGAFGAALGLIGLTLRVAVGSTLLVAVAQALPLTADLAPYSTYEDRALSVALWIALAAVLGTITIDRVNRQPIGHTARFVVAFSAAVLYLKLLVLLHPSKADIDALFHAHRLEWVLAGRYFFTQGMPGGVQFPYAIALYVFAAPWSVLTDDHMGLLRIVVCSSDVVAGALLYWVIVRTWGDRLVGVAAVVLFQTLPVAYWVQGNANLTNAFGQSIALVTMAAAIVWSLGSGTWIQLVGLTLLAAVAFLSHVSTFAQLLVTLLALAVFYRWWGGPALRLPARAVLVAATVAMTLSIGLYYGHFREAYASVLRASNQTKGAAVAGVAPQLPQAVIPTPALPARAADALEMMGYAVGWPIVLLGILGVWRLSVERVRERLVFALAAWGAACGLFLAAGIVAPAGVGHRYAIEFVARTAFAGAPAASILAARGWGWAWRAGTASRLAAAAVLVYGAIGAAQLWINWLR